MPSLVVEMGCANTRATVRYPRGVNSAGEWIVGFVGLLSLVLAAGYRQILLCGEAARHSKAQPRSVLLVIADRRARG